MLVRIMARSDCLSPWLRSYQKSIRYRSRNLRHSLSSSLILPTKDHYKTLSYPQVIEEELNKYNNEAETSQSVGTQSHMRESQERTNVVMANMMSVIQNRLSQEDLNDILQAAKQASNGASTPNLINSSSRCSDEDGREED